MLYTKYIIVPNLRAEGAKEDLMKCLGAIANDSEIKVRSVVGDTANPKRLQIEGTSEAIERLRRRFGSRLIIEEDLPLEPLG